MFSIVRVYLGTVRVLYPLHYRTVHPRYIVLIRTADLFAVSFMEVRTGIDRNFRTRFQVIYKRF